MPMNINCILYREGKCMHQAAPRRLFGPAACILSPYGTQEDPRRPAECVLRVPHGRSASMPPAPPALERINPGDE